MKTIYGLTRNTLKDEELAVVSWIKQWPKATQDNFRAFVGADSLKLISEFTMKLQKWSSRGRAAGAAATLAGYAIFPTKLTSFCGHKNDIIPTKQASGKRDFSPSSTGGSRSGSGSVNDQPAKKVQLQDNTAKYTSKVDPVPQGDMCHHCGRLHSGLCPF